VTMAAAGSRSASVSPPGDVAKLSQLARTLQCLLSSAAADLFAPRAHSQGEARRRRGARHAVPSRAGASSASVSYSAPRTAIWCGAASPPDSRLSPSAPASGCLRRRSSPACQSRAARVERARRADLRRGRRGNDRMRRKGRAERRGGCDNCRPRRRCGPRKETLRLPSELPDHPEAEARVTLPSLFARYGGDLRVRGRLRTRQERRIQSIDVRN
jgi:hypothetical protein